VRWLLFGIFAGGAGIAYGVITSNAACLVAGFMVIACAIGATDDAVDHINAGAHDSLHSDRREG
jgi:hypothetical protein